MDEPHRLVNRFQTWYSIQPRALRALLTINVVAYVLWLFPLSLIPAAAAFVTDHLILHATLPDILFEPWQLVTYGFLHVGGGFNGLIHIAFNLLWLYWIGKEYEELHGPHRLLSAYLIGAVGGALATVLLHALLPGVPGFGAHVYGASGAVLGVMTTVAVRYPYKSIGLFLIGTVRLIYVVIGVLVINLLFMGGVSLSAHLGGALAGFLLARGEAGGMDLSSWAGVFFRQGRRRGRRTSSRAPRREEPGLFGRFGRWVKSEGEPAATDRGPARIYPFQRSAEAPEGAGKGDEVDRILDKISAHGYEALTDEEKRILYEASRK